MKISVFKDKELISQYCVRSDFYGRNEKVEYSDINIIGSIIDRYCSDPERNDKPNEYKIIITADTLPNDPNTKKGRDKLYKDMGWINK